MEESRGAHGPSGRIEIRVYTTAHLPVSDRPPTTTMLAVSPTKPVPTTAKPTKSSTAKTLPKTTQQPKIELLTTKPVYAMSSAPPHLLTTAEPNERSTSAAESNERSTSTAESEKFFSAVLNNFTNFIREVKEDVKRIKRDFSHSDQQGKFYRDF